MLLSTAKSKTACIDGCPPVAFGADGRKSGSHRTGRKSALKPISLEPTEPKQEKRLSYFDCDDRWWSDSFHAWVHSVEGCELLCLGFTPQVPFVPLQSYCFPLCTLIGLGLPSQLSAQTSLDRERNALASDKKIIKHNRYLEESLLQGEFRTQQNALTSFSTIKCFDST
ncbi:hypothetical protein TNCV_3849321 [Trichonephila clavipes]|uniref:Uncharacterized protein n=1 Tax=Trichonephila clavipes TaxID=2585209 RepID=A0A8X6RJ45_TRICX|nr:hypothetical protein TNCV_3849321 [Trichonephila clavipes]